MDVIYDRIHELVATELRVDRAKLFPEAHLMLDLGADSLDLVQLVMALEASFDISVPDGDIHELQTLSDVARYVLERGSQRS